VDGGLWYRPIVAARHHLSQASGYWVEIASPACAGAGSLRCSQETNGSGGIAKGFALDGGFPTYGDSIVKAEGLGDATQNKGLGFFLTSAAQRRSDSQ
jgi:hypothetical protein